MKLKIKIVTVALSIALMGGILFPTNKVSATVTTPRILRKTWVNDISYSYKLKKPKFKSCMVTTINKHYIIMSHFQTDEYIGKVVTVKKIPNYKNFYRLRVSYAFSNGPLPNPPVYKYWYTRLATIGGKQFLSISRSIKQLNRINNMYGTIKDNGLARYFKDNSSLK
ncbi:hypothetical protein OZY43_07685 [Lactobacillus sp. ESL0785]|uniref:hypothetical protein n=1 Tax=Lactobacillus sp. ESL0785 TaxID=2983232 RepID=UPI0023F7405B|nr:hypothetical protein [Lactobacillus sp. ESL0785]WEV70807.1 hypothetical protein OZY43_07685 [Lactobacillus sp. ESL0785]